MISDATSTQLLVMLSVRCYYRSVERRCQYMAYFTKTSLPGGAGNPESHLIADYLAEKFPDRRVALSFPVGPEISGVHQIIGQQKRLAVSRPWRPEVDALVWLDGVLLLIEAKVADYLSGLGKLPLYKALIPDTPELIEFRSWEIRMRLVVPRSRPWLDRVAQDVGAEVDLYDPPWIRDYYDYRDNYWTGEYRKKRAETLAARQAAGLE